MAGAVVGRVHRESQLTTSALSREIINISVTGRTVSWTVSEEIRTQIILSAWRQRNIMATVGSLRPISLRVGAITSIIIRIVAVSILACGANTSRNRAHITVSAVASDTIINSIIVEVGTTVDDVCALA